jgi:hypothetical protein
MGYILNLNKQKYKTIDQDEILSRAGYEALEIKEILAGNMIMCTERILTGRRTSAVCVIACGGQQTL